MSSRLECFFKDPLKFVPERWIKDHPAYEKTHPYLVLPFGHGPRSCIARRLAEQNLYILLARVGKPKYEIGSLIIPFNFLILVGAAISHRVGGC